MRKFIYSISIISICFILIIGCLEFLFKNTPNYIEDLFEKLESNDSTQVLLLGNSHIQALEEPIIDGTESFNFGVGGQDIYHMHMILEHVLVKMNKKHLKQVIIGLDYDLLGYSYKTANSIWLDRLYYPVTGKLSENSFGAVLMAKSNFFRANRDFSKLTFVNSNLNSKNKDLNFLDYSPCDKRAKEHSETKFNKSLISDNIKLLESIYSLCKNHNIRLTLINLPKGNCYYDFYNKDVVYSAQKILRDFSKNKDVVFYDLWKSDEFNDEMFSDNDHLNNLGKKQLHLKLKFNSFKK